MTTTGEETKMDHSQRSQDIQPFVINHELIPTVLPMQRGLHICHDNFVDMFRKAYLEDSNMLADKCNNQ